eukprot:3714620-Prymnesium_polylepis.1
MGVDLSMRYLTSARRSDGLAPPSLEPQPFVAAFFFVAWVVLGRFVLLNMVVSIVLNEFGRIANRENGYAFLSDDQVDWVRTQNAVAWLRLSATATPPVQPWRRPFHRLATSLAFEVVVIGVILLNMGAMGAYIYAPDWGAISSLTRALVGVNVGCIVVYLLEAAVKARRAAPKPAPPRKAR